MPDAREGTPLVSIVLIGLNVERFLPDCLGSVRDANWPHDLLERLYVDSGSTDRSLEIVSREPGWQVLTLGDPNPSVAKGRNLGISTANGKYVQLLDADMLLDEGWLMRATAILERDPRIAAAFGRTRERFPRRNLYHGLRDSIWSMHPLGFSDRLPGACLLRRDAVRTCGLHLTRLRGFEDVELSQRLRRSGYVLMGVPETMCLHDSNMSSFGQYWRSNVRGGQGNYDILRSTSGLDQLRFWRELRRSAIWPVVLALSILVGGLAGRWWIPCVVAAGFALALGREYRRGRQRGGSMRAGFCWMLHWVLSKIPYCAGFVDAWWCDCRASGGVLGWARLTGN